MRLGCILRKLGLVCLLASSVLALYEGMYCGKQNCYDVLGVEPTESKKNIARVYRRLQKERHPDRNMEAMNNPATYEALQKEWHRIRTAYETLKDDESRKNYDHLLANPDEFFRHWWYYHRIRVSQQLNVWGVLVVLISIFSVCQYYFINWSYQHNLSGILEVDDKILRHYINRAVNGGQESRVRTEEGKDLPKEEQKKAIIELYGEEMAMEGNFNLCLWSDVLWCRLLTFPNWLPLQIMKWVRWYHRRYMDEPYSHKEQEYLTRKALYLSQKAWEHHGEEERENLVSKQLWLEDNLAVYK
eukprot:Ihof_evm6s285 gene=Ihof_evmTU6s285